ncbi:thioredoxin domain-containing protein [Qipengyuania sp.]|uniref:thioredoxin domain-containing protein n=1 Tax=Qipengyuania sp. TaxID=2004515 RepID=UPI003734F91E
MHLSRLAFLAPLTLALAACGNADEPAAGASGAVEGEAIAAIPAPAGSSWLEIASKTEQGGFVLGNPDAPIKLVEYASHTCAHCATFAETATAALQEEYISSGRVSFEIRPIFLNPLDVAIDVLAQCGTPTSYHGLSDQVWGSLDQITGTMQNNPAAFEAAMSAPPEQRFVSLAQAGGLIDFFAARGLSADQARQCLGDTAKIEQIANQSQTVAQADEVTGTPTFFLNGRRLDGNTWAAIEPALQSAGAR